MSQPCRDLRAVSDESVLSQVRINPPNTAPIAMTTAIGIILRLFTIRSLNLIRVVPLMAALFGRSPFDCAIDGCCDQAFNFIDQALIVRKRAHVQDLVLK